MCAIDECSDKNVPIQTTLRVMGGITLVAGIIQLIYTSLVYSYMDNVKIGGWWAAMFVAATGGFLIASPSRGMVLAALLFSVFGAILCAIAMIVDGIAYGVVNSLTTCINTQSDEISGDKAYSGKLFLCHNLIHISKRFLGCDIGVRS